MPEPNLTFTVEPVESNRLVYLDLASRTSEESSDIQISVRLKITNNENSTVHVNKVSFILHTLIPPPLSFFRLADLDINPGNSEYWHFAESDNIVIAEKQLVLISVSVHCNGFDQPVTNTFPLSRHTSPTPEGSYKFPADTLDLKPTEYWSGIGASHGAGSLGSQLFAYDMGVVGYNPTTTSLEDRYPGTTGDKNEDFRIWGKKIYAIADGTVLHFLNDVESNSRPTTEEDKEKWKDKPFGGAGNHFYIQHGTEVVLYAHMQKDSLNSNLLSVNAVVKKGDFLGLAGNSGSSSAPHLHIHAIKGSAPEFGPLRPLPFHGIYVLAKSKFHPPSVTDPWTKVENHGLPPESSVIWPAPLEPSSSYYVGKIIVTITTGDKNNADTNGKVYLAIGGREFRLDKPGNQFEIGQVDEFLIGDNSNIENSNGDANEVNHLPPAVPTTSVLESPLVKYDELNMFPVYLRFEPQNENDNWNVTKVYVKAIRYPSKDRAMNYRAFVNPNDDNIWLGEKSSLFLGLRTIGEDVVAFS